MFQIVVWAANIDFIIIKTGSIINVGVCEINSEPTFLFYHNKKPPSASLETNHQEVA